MAGLEGKLAVANPLDYIERFAVIGSVTVDKAKVTFTVADGEGDDKFVFTLTGNKPTLGESVMEIVKYLVRASNVVETTLAQLPTVTKEEALSLASKNDPVFTREELDKMLKAEQGFEVSQDEGIALDPEDGWHIPR